jgi:acetyl esterase/lipase
MVTPGRTTIVYRRAEGCEIALDVYRPAVDGPVPVVVWVHGGALIMGSRAGIPGHLFSVCREHDAAIVSIDYRLAPQVQLPAIIEDVQAAFRWLRDDGPAVAGLDPTRIVVAGASAGGYLTLMTGFAVEPKPLALVSYYGYGDVDGPWYTTPSEHYRQAVPLYTREEAVGGLRAGVVASPPDQEQADARRRYYHYLRQNGLWTREVTGFDPISRRSELDPFCPARNVTPEYPPTMLLHGTADTDVPYGRSVEMARELARHGVQHELVTLPGAEHGLVGVDPALVTAANAKALAFIGQHLR